MSAFARSLLRGSMSGSRSCSAPSSSSSASSSSSFLLTALRHATKKAGGSTKNGRDSPGQRLGVKRFGGEAVAPGNILIRQRGSKVKSGDNTKIGRDHTIYAVSHGWVHFKYNKFKKFQTISVSNVNPNIPSKKMLAEMAQLEAEGSVVQQQQQQLQQQQQ